MSIFQLRRGAEFRRHHVERHIDEGHDGCIALADAGGFDDDQIEVASLLGGDDFRQRGGNFGAGVAGGQRAHEDIRMLDGIHADAVAEQRAAGGLRDGSMEIRPILTVSS